MKFEISKTALLKALSMVLGAVERKNTIPILQNVKIEIKGQNVSFAATDMDILITSSFEANVKQAGVTTVSAQMFHDIVRKIPDETILTIEKSKDSVLQIKYGKSKYNLPTMEAEEFPNLSEGEMDQEITVDSEKLSKMIDKTRFAISNDETRYYLNGLFLQSTNKSGKFELRCVATDGHRLALSYLADENLSSEFGIIIPKKSVSEIKKIVDGSKKTTIAVSRVKIKVTADNTTIISKLIDGEFPDYEKVLPKNNNQIATINKKIFFDAIDRASTVANDKHRSVKLITEKNKLTLQVNTADGSFAHEEIDIDYSGSDIETGFNSRYLLDVIGQVDKDDLYMKFKDNASPALVEPKESNNLFVVMPVRI